MRMMKGLVCVAVLSLALQPCLVCARGLDAPEVREPCHGDSQESVTACPEGVGAVVAVVSPAPIGVLATAPEAPTAVLGPCLHKGPRHEPSSVAEGPPLWLRHASLLV